MWDDFEYSKYKDDPFSDYQNADQEQLNSYLMTMCIYESLPHIQYLLTAPELKIHANFHADNDEVFKCLKNCNLKIIEYLIFDYGIENNSNIEEILDDANPEFALAVRNMFKLRQCKELKESLPVNQIKPKKVKV